MEKLEHCGYVQDELPLFVRKVISNGNKFLEKPSTYNNLVAMAATVVCNYNETAGFSRRDPVFMNGRVHHYMKIASSTSQNCGISYFIFDDIASLAGSADAQNVDPEILKEICEGLKNENPYCADLRFIGVEARAHAEGITIIPRMVDQVQQFDVCSVVNNRQTGTMTLQVRTHTNSVSDVNMLEQQFHALRRLVASKAGFSGFTSLPGFREKVPSSQDHFFVICCN